MTDRAPAYLTAPPGCRRPGQRPAAVVNLLARQLRTLGLAQLYGAACQHYGVLSVSYGVTAWTNGRLLWWRSGQNQTTWPAADALGAAMRLAELASIKDPGPRELEQGPGGGAV